MNLRKTIYIIIVVCFGHYLLNTDKPNSLPNTPVSENITVQYSRIEPVRVNLVEQPTLIYQIPQSIGASSYTYGYCTWYVATKRYVPSGLGNAITWYSRAQSRGMQVGATPTVGAIAWSIQTKGEGHVAYVEEVYGDGSYLISEMNVRGWNVKSTRVVSSGYLFIY